MATYPVHVEGDKETPRFEVHGSGGIAKGRKQRDVCKVRHIYTETHYCHHLYRNLLKSYKVRPVNLYTCDATYKQYQRSPARVHSCRKALTERGLQEA